MPILSEKYNLCSALFIIDLIEKCVHYYYNNSYFLAMTQN